MIPTASGPSPPASPAALLSVTATELRPGRLPYRRACSSGYHGAVAALSAATIASLPAVHGTSRNPGYSQVPARHDLGPPPGPDIHQLGLGQRHERPGGREEDGEGAQQHGERSRARDRGQGQDKDDAAAEYGQPAPPAVA